jgi:hypothetical protein
MLATTLYLDFGSGIGMGNTLATTMGGIRNINGQAGLGGATGVGINGLGTGPDLKDQILGATDSTPVSLTPLNYDFDGNGVQNAADLVAMGNSVQSLVQRALEPFDINVQIGSANSLAALAATLGANNTDPTGHFDAYSFVIGSQQCRSRIC